MQQFDPNMLRMILSLPDDQLWTTIKVIAEKNGVALPNGTPPKSELSRLRDAMSSANPNPEEAKRIMEKYKKEKS